MGGTGQVLTGQQEEVTAFLPSKLVRDWSEHFALPANLRRKEAGSGPGGPWYSWATTAETRCVLHPSLTRCSALSPRDCFPALPLWIPQCRAPRPRDRETQKEATGPCPCHSGGPNLGRNAGNVDLHLAFPTQSKLVEKTQPLSPGSPPHPWGLPASTAPVNISQT